MGDFNILGVQWLSSLTVKHRPGGSLYNFVAAHDLAQLEQQPTRQSAFFDLIFVSPHYTSVVVNELPPIGKLDHNA